MSLRRVPLVAWAVVVCVGLVLLPLAAAAGALTVLGRLDVPTARALCLGLCVGLVLSVAAVALARDVGRQLRSLSDDALQRLRGSGTPPYGRTVRPGGPTTAELADLSGVLDALHLRVRLADEVAEQHRRDAHTAGAGVFELLSGLLAAEEGARGQLAAELHDTAAQTLAVARALLAQRPGDPATLAHVRDLVDDAEEQVRAVMARTRPPALRDGDLAHAVDDLRCDLHQRYGLRVDLRWPDAATPLPVASAVTLYRFFQEALLNVVKHGEVDEAVLTLLVEPDTVQASVRDEGPGFDPTAVRPERGRHVGLGLLGERARLSGGRLEVSSAPGCGTTLRLRLPRPAGLPVMAGSTSGRPPPASADQGPPTGRPRVSPPSATSIAGVLSVRSTPSPLS